jgi:hypothetical protein
MIVLGDLLSSPEAPYVVGVCSADGGSESVGDVSESVGSCGEVMTLLSYSSSASESAWYAVGKTIVTSMTRLYVSLNVVKAVLTRS